MFLVEAPRTPVEVVLVCSSQWGRTRQQAPLLNARRGFTPTDLSHQESPAEQRLVPPCLHQANVLIFRESFDSSLSPGH